MMPTRVITAAMLLLLATACSKKENLLTDQDQALKDSMKSTALLPGLTGNADTILKVNYENGQLSSGIQGVRGTVAPGADAAYLVPGDASTYAIAHKVTLGNPDYFSAEAYRSESDALENQASLFFPGMERRYEFSVYLKDWTAYNPANPAYGDNIFQLKVSGGDPVPVRILTKRNAIAVRYDATGNATLISDFRPQVNKWIHFRIDVKWTLDNTGYFKIYSRYANEQDYTLRFQNLTARTFTGNQLNNGQKGYLKWGVYREAGKDANGNVISSDNVLTRIAYHDNIRIIALPIN